MSPASTFRAQLATRETLYGAWCTIPSPLSVRLLATAGVDYVVVDLQHGGATEHDLPGLTSAIRLVVWTMAILLILGEVGIDLAPLLAGAGVAGVAVAFGAQSLMRDFLSGFFILFENQFAVGDQVTINAVGGSVDFGQLFRSIEQDFAFEFPLFLAVPKITGDLRFNLFRGSGHRAHLIDEFVDVLVGC